MGVDLGRGVDSCLCKGGCRCECVRVCDCMCGVRDTGWVVLCYVYLQRVALPVSVKTRIIATPSRHDMAVYC